MAPSLAACLLVTVSSALAWGSCGDYVQLSKHVDARAALERHAPEASQAPKKPARTPMPTQQQRPPCHGRHCSSGPAPTPLTPVATSPLSLEWGALLVFDLPMRGANKSRLEAESVRSHLLAVSPATPPP